jgi:hypothetical protein
MHRSSRSFSLGGGIAVVASLILLGGLLLGQAEEKPAADDLAVQVRTLVRQLDAAQLKQRDAAEEALVKLGPAILPHLPKDVDPDKAEVAQRVGRVRQKLQRAEAETTMQASLVTLRGKMPLSKVLEAIRQQTGNKIVDKRKEVVGNAPDPEVSVDFQKTPFWQALDKVLDQAGLGVYPYGQEKSVEIGMQPGEEGSRTKRASYSGPFRFEPVRLVAARDLRRAQGESLQLEIEVSWEPRVEPITLQQRTQDLKALVQGGQRLAIEEAEYEAPVEPGPIAQKIVIPLALPPRSVKQIERFEGTINVLIPGKIEAFRFTGLEKAKGLSKRIGSATVVIDETAKNNKLWEVFVTLRLDNARDSLASHRTWAFENPAFLEGPDGKPLAHVATDPTKRTESEIGQGYLFNVESLANYTFVYKTPTAVFNMPVKYEFRDVPLP